MHEWHTYLLLSVCLQMSLRTTSKDYLAMIDITFGWKRRSMYLACSRSRLLLRPTILRKDHSQIWATYNPTHRTDAISKV